MAWWMRRPASRRTRVMAVDKAVNQLAVPMPMPASRSTAPVAVRLMWAAEAAANMAAQDAMVRGFAASGWMAQ
jgi:hypothetical protein